MLGVFLPFFVGTPHANANEDSNQEIAQMRAAYRLHDLYGAQAAWLSKARSFISFDTMSEVHPLFGGAPSTAPFSFSAARNGELAHPAAVGAFDDPCGFFVTPSRNALAALRDDFGLRMDLYEAAIFQAASDTLPSARSSAGAARFNARADLLLFRTEGEGMGSFTAQLRQNNRFPTHDSSLTESVASPVKLDSLASGEATVLSRFFYAQSFLDDRVKVTVGKLNPNDYIALNMFASDETTQYLAQQFDGNDVFPLAFNNQSEGVALQALLTDWLYLDAVVTNAQGAVERGLNFSFAEGLQVSAETGVLFEWLDRPGRVSFAWCGSNAVASATDGSIEEVPWGNSYAFIAQYYAQNDLGVWFQWAWGERDIVLTSTNEGGLGVTIENAFGRKGDGCGIAAGWSTPKKEGRTTQGMLEAYYRMQVTGSLQVSLDAQVLLPTTTNELSEPTVLGAIRAVFRF